ncbi:MAG: phosphotransferase [Pseudomonadota bacterium]
MSGNDRRIPRDLDDITPGWLNDHVFPDHGGNRVSDLTYTSIGDDRGFLSQTVRVEVDRPRSEAHLPDVFVVKIRPNTQESREAEAMLNGFSREVRFYSDLAEKTAARLSKVFFADLAADGAALVMEDLSHFEGGDQVVGLAHQQVCDVIEAVAPVHAAFWNSPHLDELHWAPTVDHFNLDSFSDAWPEFEELYGLRIGESAREIGRYLTKNVDRLEAKIASRSRSIVHGDLRADNILFGKDEHDGEVVVLDWQLVMRSLAAFDIARLYGGSEPIAERASRAREMSGLWHDALRRSGVSGYSEADAWTDFRIAALHCVTIPVKVHALFHKTPLKRAAQLRDAMAQRFFACAVEVDALNVL